MKLMMLGVIAFVSSTAGIAQAQVPTQQTISPTTQQTPNETHSTTTSSAKTPLAGATETPAQTQTTTARTTSTTPTDTADTPVGPTQSSTTTTNGGAIETASAADVKAGVSVFDPKGGLVGKVESVSGANAVVNAGGTRAAIPVASFAKNDKGLVISLTKSQLEASAKDSSRKAGKAKTKTAIRSTTKPK